MSTLSACPCAENDRGVGYPLHWLIFAAMFRALARAAARRQPLGGNQRLRKVPSILGRSGDPENLMDPRNARTPILNQDDADKKREEIRQYFHTTYSLDERLYETLASEDAFYLRPEPLRHPLIFYLGHTAAFYINKLIVARITNQRIDPRFESMFAVGVNEMSWDDLDAAHYDWPRLSEVKAYRDTVRVPR